MIHTTGSIPPIEHASAWSIHRAETQFSIVKNGMNIP